MMRMMKMSLMMTIDDDHSLVRCYDENPTKDKDA